MSKHRVTELNVARLKKNGFLALQSSDQISLLRYSVLWHSGLSYAPHLSLLHSIYCSTVPPLIFPPPLSLLSMTRVLMIISGGVTN